MLCSCCVHSCKISSPFLICSDLCCRFDFAVGSFWSNDQILRKRNNHSLLVISPSCIWQDRWHRQTIQSTDRLELNTSKTFFRLFLLLLNTIVALYHYMVYICTLLLLLLPGEFTSFWLMSYLFLFFWSVEYDKYYGFSLQGLIYMNEAESDRYKSNRYKSDRCNESPSWLDTGLVTNSDEG